MTLDESLLTHARTEAEKLAEAERQALVARAEYHTAIRRLHVDRIRANARVQPTEDLEPFDPGVPFRDTAVEGFENAAAAKAFASLPERWQAVLWHAEVEGQKPAEVAVLLGMSANSVSALAYRAREGGLITASSTSAPCRPTCARRLTTSAALGGGSSRLAARKRSKPSRGSKRMTHGVTGRPVSRAQPARATQTTTSTTAATARLAANSRPMSSRTARRRRFTIGI